MEEQIIQMDMDVQVEPEIVVEPQKQVAVLNGYKGKNGTGGLLIIYSNNLKNGGIIKSDGTGTTIHPKYATGGSSGAGSVNIFYKGIYNNTGTIQAIGGSAGNGGAGGNGTVTVGNISTGTFVK